ncbi:MAG: hypothetical protein JKY56_00500 [Kofleriaceae bacterium]|nr:hypothetical protein [Kofleriaceae bacterium]
MILLAENCPFEVRFVVMQGVLGIPILVSFLFCPDVFAHKDRMFPIHATGNFEDLADEFTPASIVVRTPMKGWATKVTLS